jgi:integrase
MCQGCCGLVCTAGVNLMPERQTLAQFLEQWLSDIVAQRCRQTTRKVYTESVRRIIKHIGQIQLSKLTAQHVQRMLKALADEGYAPATVDRARDVLINALNTATEWQLIPRNVAKSTAPPKVEQYEAKVLTTGEAQQLMRAAQGDRLELLWRMVLSLGLRKGEILGLRWSDVDFDARAMQIAVNLQLVNGKLVLVKPKTKESQRILPLPPLLVAALRQHKTQQIQEQLVAGNQWKEHGLVFCTRVGTPIAPRNLTRSWQALLKRAGLSHLRFHDLRHSCASFLAAQPEKVHPKVVQQMLGHSDLRTTLRIYTHVTDEQKREAAAILDALLDNGKEKIG